MLFCVGQSLTTAVSQACFREGRGLVVSQKAGACATGARLHHMARAPPGNDAAVKRCPDPLQQCRSRASMHLSLASGGSYSEWSLRPTATTMGDKRKNRKRKNSGDLAEYPTRTLKQYTIDEKLEIIDFAKSMGNRAAGREYNVAESSIREWRKNEQKLRCRLMWTRQTFACRNLSETDPDRSRLSGAGRKVDAKSDFGEDLEQGLLQAPLSLVLPGSTPDASATENNDHEASLGAASNVSTHSSSPTLSLASVNGNGYNGSSSSRRKAKQPKKLICNEV